MRALIPQETHQLDEGAWVYLSLPRREPAGAEALSQALVDVCEKSGWPAVTWSAHQVAGSSDASDRLEGMSHAVEHADVVVVVVDASSSIDAELECACRHRRPLVVLRVDDDGGRASEVRTMLDSYERAFTVECSDAEECPGGLRNALADPSFERIIAEAAGESSGCV